MITFLACVAVLGNLAAKLILIRAMKRQQGHPGWLPALAFALSFAATLLWVADGAALNACIEVVTCAIDAALWVSVSRGRRERRAAAEAEVRAAVEASLRPSDREWLTFHQHLAGGEVRRG